MVPTLSNTRKERSLMKLKIQRLKATPEELQEIGATLHLRRQLEPEGKAYLAEIPAAATASIQGAFRWAIAVAWQDQPLFVIAGLGGWLASMLSAMGLL